MKTELETKFDKFRVENSKLTENELTEKFYFDVIYKKFEYGEYASIGLVIDEMLLLKNIVNKDYIN